MELQRLEGFPDPDPSLEQYLTPPPLAAEILNLARLRGELKGRVLDLGTGTGTFAVGASLLGAETIGVELDSKALSVARRNANHLGARVEFIEADVSQTELEGDLVIQNPPFGSQEKGNDRPFIRRALKSAPVTYSLHRGGTGDFVESYVEEHGGEAEREAGFQVRLPRTQDFHTSESESVEVVLYRFVSDTHQDHT